MLDLNWIRENPESFDHHMQRRGLLACSEEILKKDEAHREVLRSIQELQSRRNVLSKALGKAKSSGEDPGDLTAEAQSIKEKLPPLETVQKMLEHELHTLLAALPNVLADDVPQGTTEDDFELVSTHGAPRSFAFTPQWHYVLGETLGLMNFEEATRMSGSRFVVLKGLLARLERALGQFMLDVHTQRHGYTEVSPPLLVREQALFGTGQLPKFGEAAFQTTHGHWLISTSEVCLTNLVREQILEESSLPLRYTALTPCFRSEAGAAGKDTRGMMRQHQFWKVELVSIVPPEDSEQEQLRMRQCAETVLSLLELPYRVTKLCSTDTSAGALRTYDLEVWLPGEGRYREISSCSTCGDFQARRMNARYRPQNPDKGKIRFVHTLNGSGVAVGRALIAILENYQRADGSIALPSVLHPYMTPFTEIPAP